MSARIAVYFDEGVNPILSSEVAQALPKRSFPVSRSFFLQEGWEEQIDLVVIPGGRDRPYAQALSGEANSRIRRFVEQGGCYLGICAGGYYGCKQIAFEEGGPLEIVEERELAFFPGRAVGPAYGKNRFRYESEAGACLARIAWQGEIVEVYFNGGCYFEDAAQHPQVEVLATYRELEGEPAALIACQVGQGRAFLSGIHLERGGQDILNALIK